MVRSACSHRCPLQEGESRGVSAYSRLGSYACRRSYPATPIGINLPNADWIRATYGSKSVTIDNIHEAYRLAARHSGMDAAFVPDPATRALLEKYEGGDGASTYRPARMLGTARVSSWTASRPMLSALTIRRWRRHVRPLRPILYGR